MPPPRPSPLHATWDPRAGLIAHGFEQSIEHNGRVKIAFAGYLTNAAALARGLNLENQDHLRIILAGFARWGESLPERLEGYFSCILATSDSGAIAFTSAVGTIPLYYAASSDGAVSVANRLVDLLEEGPDRALDDEYLADFLLDAMPVSERTPFRGIARLMPGTSLTIGADGIRLHRYWTPEFGSQDTGLGWKELQEPFRAALDGAIRPLASRYGSAWCELSGGLDSSSVTCVAARAGFTSLGTWSVYDPVYPAADERKWIAEVTNATGLPGTLVDISSQLPFSSEPGLGDFLGEPYLGLINGSQAAAKNRQLADAGVELLLTGFAGDLVLGAAFGDHPVHLADAFFRFDLMQGWRELQSWKRDSPMRRSWPFWLLHGVARPAWQHMRGNAARIRPEFPLQPWMSEQFIRDFGMEHRRKRTPGTARRAPGEQAIADGLVSAALHVSIEWQRARPFETVHPLLDRRLIEFMVSLPDNQRQRPNCDRYLQRHALKGILPEPIRRRSDKGFGTPVFVEGLARSTAWQEFLTTDSQLVERGIASKQGWSRAIEQASVGQTNGDKFLHAAIAIEVWLKQLKDRAGNCEAPARPRRG
jgi:asparagine synthase (glutamine-hydrolysing)